MALVYKITNKINSKSYIGYTRKSVDTRFAEHLAEASKNKDNRKFYNAIRKYGTSCWEIEVLKNNLSPSQAKEKEIELILEHNTYNNGYNATKGGDGNNGIMMSRSSNVARSNALKGVPKNYDRMLNKKHSQTTKQKISAAHTGMPKPWVKWDDEHIIKRALTRRAITEEQHRELKILRDKGYTFKEISNKLGLSIHICKKWARMDWEVQLTK